MSIQGKTLCVLTPMYGNMATRNFIQSFIQLSAQCIKYGIALNFVFVGNESLIQRGRNRLVDAFLKSTKATHAIFIDADIGFDANDVLAMLEQDHDILGAACVKKSINWNRVQSVVKKNGREYSGEELARIAGDYVVNFETIGALNFNTSQPVEVKHLGTGLLMISRKTFLEYKKQYPDRWYEPKGDPAALPGPIWDFFQVRVDPDTREMNSEDYCFCEDCKAIGFKIWLCPWVHTTHDGSHTFVGDMNAVGQLAGTL